MFTLVTKKNVLIFNNNHGLISFVTFFFIFSSLEKNGNEKQKGENVLIRSRDHILSFSHISRENWKEEKCNGNKKGKRKRTIKNSSLILLEHKITTNKSFYGISPANSNKLEGPMSSTSGRTPRGYFCHLWSSNLNFFLFERSWKKLKMTSLLCACAVLIILQTQKCQKRAPRSVEFNFLLIAIYRHKRYSQNERRRIDLQNLRQIFTLLPGT